MSDAALLRACARRACAQRTWRTQSSYDPHFKAFLRASGIVTELEWFQALGLKQVMAGASASARDRCVRPANALLNYSAGLGKTLLMISIVLVFKLRAVVVMPAVLLHQWHVEICKHTTLDAQHVVTCRGTIDNWPVISEHVRFVLVSYATLSRTRTQGRVLPWAHQPRWMVLIDEVQYIANRMTLRFQSSLELVRNDGMPRAVIVASGTPVKNGAGDMAAIAAVLNCDDVANSMHEPKWWRRTLDKHDAFLNSMLHAWRRQYVLSMGRDVLERKLPPLIEAKRVYTPFDTEVRLTEILASNARRKCNGSMEHVILFDTFTRSNCLLTHPLAPCGHRVVRALLETAGMLEPQASSASRGRVTCVRCHGARGTIQQTVSRTINDGLSSDDETSSARMYSTHTCHANHPICSACVYATVLEGCPLCTYNDALDRVGISRTPASAQDLISMSSKFTHMSEVLRSICADDSVLIFGTSVAAMLMLEVMVRHVCPWRDVVHLNYTVSDRDTRIERWRNTPRAVLISGIGIGGCGLTLVPHHDTGSSVWVLFSAITINGCAMSQATNRAYRLGQRRTVTTVQFYPRGTIQSQDGWLAQNHARIDRECGEVLPELNCGVSMRPSRIDASVSKGIVHAMREIVNLKRPMHPTA